MTEPNLHASRLTTLAGYGAMIGATALAFWGIRALGSELYAPPGNAGQQLAASGASASGHTLLQVLLALLVIVAVSRLFGALFRHLHQPAVVGEVIAGIALGPSLFGRIAPGLAAQVLPPSVAPSLNVIAQVGVMLFMFLVGVELDTSLLRKKGHSALAISHASIVAPLLLGGLTSLWLYPRLSTAEVPFFLFAMFMGVAMSVTAFPVLARILTDRGIHKSKLGVIALSCAAVDDVTAWCLLALIVSMASAEPARALLTLGLTLAYVGCSWLFVRPLVHRYVRQQDLRGELGKNALAVVISGLFFSALITEYIGIHAIFGAFLVGTLIPHDSLLARGLSEKLEDLAVVLLLPVFFAFTGLRTQIGLVNGLSEWLICLAIIAIACAGKLGGTYIAARLTGLGARDAASLGALMNTRGLMELVVLNIGLDLGVISPTLFAMMVLMAIVTTLLTSPLLGLLQRGGELAELETANAAAALARARSSR